MAVCCSKSLGEITVLGLQFLEQSGILDGDHRLVGKGGNQLDLFVCERARASDRLTV